MIEAKQIYEAIVSGNEEVRKQIGFPIIETTETFSDESAEVQANG